VFFAVDADIDPVSVEPYFQGVHDAYALGGVYGSYRVVHRIETEYGIVGWQTAAWSNGVRDGVAMVFQSGQQRVIGGMKVDIDYAASLGKWAYGGPDMTPDELLDFPIARQGLAADGTAKTGSTNLRNIVAYSDAGWELPVRLLSPMLKELGDQLTAVRQQLDRIEAAGAGSGSVTLSAAQLTELEASARADASEAMLAASKALAVPAPAPAAAGPDTPA